MIKEIKDINISVYYIIVMNDNCENETRYIKSFVQDESNIYYIKFDSNKNQALHMSHDDAVTLCEYINSINFYDVATLKRYLSIEVEDSKNATGILDEMSSNDRIDISRIVDEPKLIYGWEDLSKVPPSHTHIIDIEDPNDCNGHIRSKIKSNTFNYLSTHTFYGYKTREYAASTRRLQECGFNIVLDNWDKDSDNLDDEQLKDDPINILNLGIKNSISKNLKR